MIRTVRKWCPWWGLVLGSCLVVLLAQGVMPERLPTAVAQSANPKVMADQVYERLPHFPREDQYPERGSSTQADSTLVSRLIQYHLFVKGRPPTQRFDWQITLADYLGINDYLLAETYPGVGFLATNPMTADTEAIQQLSREQRRALVQVLVEVFTGRPSGDSHASSEPRTQSSSPVAAPAAPVLPPLPTPGSADLLLPRPSTPERSRPTGEAQYLLLD